MSEYPAEKPEEDDCVFCLNCDFEAWIDLDEFVKEYPDSIVEAES